MKPDHISDEAREKLNDACLSILMEEYLGVEGAKLHGEAMRLNSDAEFQYPDTLDEKCRGKIDAHFKKEKRRGALEQLRKAANVAAALAVIAALGWAAFSSAPEGIRLGAFWGRFYGTTPFELMFGVVFAIVVCFFLVILVRGIAEWSKNNVSPRLAVEAVVVSKRENVTGRRHSGNAAGTHEYDTSVSTSYYVTFQVESGDRMELHVSGRDYGQLAEGDFGKLSFQGTRFLGFERV